MAVMGMRLAQRVNGVSVLHGQVSREMFAGLWPGFDTAEVPIGSITNGVHAPTWVASEVSDLGDSGSAASADGSRLWEIRRQLRARLVTETRRRLRESWRQRGASGAELTWIDDVLDENVLTIGFARRVPSYKRLTLMLCNQERLTELLLDPERPVQIVIAGKAHPADDGGKLLIQQMVKFTDDPRVRHRIVFLPDYDMALAHALVQGCDVWLNNPLRPLEACGTSGMKSALNGGLNLSIRDGWWDEWYDGANGWAIPSADGVSESGRRDEVEAAALYDLISQSVAPLFYDNAGGQPPARWLEMVAHTLRTLGPRAQATRMVREYTTELYQPAAVASRALAGPARPDGGRLEYGPARELAAWQDRVRKAWQGISIEHVEAAEGEQMPGARLSVSAVVALGELTPDDVTVQVVYGRVGDEDELAEPAHAALALESPPDGQSAARYAGEVELGGPGPFGYTVRVLPAHPLLATPAELGLVTFPDAPAGLTNGDLR
jgi:starch phosphorylase